MLYNAKNASVTVGESTMDYIRFGTGPRILVILPGLGDGLQTVKGTALPMAWMYRQFAKDFTVYAFSRINELPEGYSTRDMARDQAEAMVQLGIEKADIFAVSMGGMIAQHLAVDFPEMVNKLILTVTSPRPTPLLQESVEGWIALAHQKNHTAFMQSNLVRIYSDSYCRKNKWMAPILGKLTAPKSYNRFLIQANACLTHNTVDSLNQIHVPTFVIGGEQDKALGADASREIAAVIPGARLKMYPEWGHGLYEEAKDFNGLILDFLLE